MKDLPRVGETSLKTLLNVTTMFHEQNKPKKRVKPEFARFKMKIYWRALNYKDPGKNGQPMYSYDYFYRHVETKKIKVEDEREGLTELINEAKKQRDQDTFISVVIWACLSKEKQTSNSKYNCEVVKMIRNCSRTWYNPTLEFTDGRLNLAKLTYVDNYSYFK